MMVPPESINFHVQVPKIRVFKQNSRSPLAWRKVMTFWQGTVGLRKRSGPLGKVPNKVKQKYFQALVMSHM
jgi:hypothetical protein